MVRVTRKTFFAHTITDKIYEPTGEIKQNWTWLGNFDISFCVIFNHKCQSFISVRNTEH